MFVKANATIRKTHFIFYLYKSMEIVKLQFQTPQDLTHFRKSVQEGILEIDIANLTLVCDCTKIDIARAMNNGATVVEDKFTS
jgi:hypothetical protein